MIEALEFWNEPNNLLQARSGSNYQRHYCMACCAPAAHRKRLPSRSQLGICRWIHWHDPRLADR